MATGLRRKRVEPFKIHEDLPSTEDTQMADEVVVSPSLEVGDEDVALDLDAEETQEEEQDDQDEQDNSQDTQRERHHQEAAQKMEDDEQQDGDDEGGEEEEEDEEEDEEDSSDDEHVDENVQHDMEKINSSFPGFRQQFRLIKRIGEEDLQYDRFDNSWDWDKENEKWTSPPLKRTRSFTREKRNRPRRKPKFVAVKKIYVTSSPLRILNELELLHDLRSSPSVCPLITAFRHTDQVVAVLPYFKHHDFREYYRRMTVPDMAIYLRSLFTALRAVHKAKILHRDIKPTNFLYDPETRRGVLVDFGLAEREGSESKPCLCHEDSAVRKARLRSAYQMYLPTAAGATATTAGGGGGVAAAATTAGMGGYPKNDTRPSRRANRAGTRGFRAPEVLFKCTEQTTKIDIWSAGVILLTLLSRRFPFFNSADDVEAMIEIATIFGSKRMKVAGQLHGCMFETSIPTVGREGFSLEKIILWSNCRMDQGKTTLPLTDEERLAVRFLGCCLDLDPSSRISAEQALQHEFLRETTTVPLGRDIPVEEDEMDML